MPKALYPCRRIGKGTKSTDLELYIPYSQEMSLHSRYKLAAIINIASARAQKKLITQPPAPALSHTTNCNCEAGIRLYIGREQESCLHYYQNIMFVYYEPTTPAATRRCHIVKSLNRNAGLPYSSTVLAPPLVVHPLNTGVQAAVAANQYRLPCNLLPNQSFT